MTEEEKSALEEYFEGMEIPLKIVRTPMKNDSFRGTFNCYLCARNRRRILFEEAARLGIRKIALGHHLDDIVETILINLCFRGTFDTMRPVQDFFSGDLRIIRPMCELPETAVIRVAERLDLPVVEKRCPHEQDNVRARLKPIIRELSHIDTHTRTHMFEAVFSEDDERRLQDRENGGTLQSGRLP